MFEMVLLDTMVTLSAKISLTHRSDGGFILMASMVDRLRLASEGSA